MNTTFPIARLATVSALLLLGATSALALDEATNSTDGQKQKQNPKRASQHILKKNDTNSDGFLEQSEFKGKPKRFERLDTNHDGKLDATELQAAFEARAKHAGKKKKTV